MSNQDSFIDEVSEEVRRDKLFRLFKRYGWMGALAVVLIVGGAALNEWRKSRAAAEAQAAGDALIAALDEANAGDRAVALSNIPTGDNAGRNAVVAMLAADAKLDAGDREGAIAELEAVATASQTPTPFRDLATLKVVIIAGTSMDPDERIARMNALTLGGSAYRLMAMEQIALAEIEKGNADAAISQLRDIIADTRVTQDLRRRASQLIVALGGTLGHT